MPNIKSIPPKQAPISVAARQEQKYNLTPDNNTLNVSPLDSISKGILESAQILAKLRQQSPSLANKFLTEFKKKIRSAGYSALTSLGSIAKSIVDTLNTSKSKSIPQRSASSENMTVPKGFLWKPVADSPPHGLVILTPSEWTGSVSRVSVLGPSGEEIASGRDAGIGNGDRQHFRFNRAGNSFPDGVFVKIRFKNGTEQTVLIRDSASRLEGK
jgi:hypothetical protein